MLLLKRLRVNSVYPYSTDIANLCKHCRIIHINRKKGVVGGYGLCLNINFLRIPEKLFIITEVNSKQQEYANKPLINNY